MKLRIRGDSVRLRLTRGEVANLAAGNAVEEATRFPGGARFRYVLRTRAGVAAVDAGFAADTLTIDLSEIAAREWASSERVEIRALLPLSDGELSVLVEKDFPCLTTRPGEDDSDAFPRTEPTGKC